MCVFIVAYFLLNGQRTALIQSVFIHWQYRAITVHVDPCSIISDVNQNGQYEHLNVILRFFRLRNLVRRCDGLNRKIDLAREQFFKGS